MFCEKTLPKLAKSIPHQRQTSKPPRERPGNELSQNVEMLSKQLQAYTTATNSLHIYKSIPRIRPVYYLAQPPCYNESLHEQSPSSHTTK